MAREKKPLQFKQDVIDEVERIKLEFNAFSDGIRCLFLIHRNKEGGDTNNTKVKKVVTTNSKEFWEQVCKLVQLKNESGLPYRIYSAVNERNIDKAIRKFKYEQLDADYYDGYQRIQFYLDVQNRWIGCLMQPQQKLTSYFMFDVDSADNGATLKALSGNEVEIIKSYKTKNGWHIITQPFKHYRSP